MTREQRYVEFLNTHEKIYKIPYIRIVEDIAEDWPAIPSNLVGDNGGDNNTEPIISQLRDIGIKENNKTKEKTIQIYQKGATISQMGRLRGNMEYLEDCWNVQIQPVSFKYAFVKDTQFETTNAVQSKIRDKYLKIRVRYDGTQYVMVNAVKTLYTISYA